MDAVRLSTSIVHKMGETQTIQKRSSNVFRVLDYYFFFDIFTRVCFVLANFIFWGTPKLTTTTTTTKFLHEFNYSFPAHFHALKIVIASNPTPICSSMLLTAPLKPSGPVITTLSGSFNFFSSACKMLTDKRPLMIDEALGIFSPNL